MERWANDKKYYKETPKTDERKAKKRKVDRDPRPEVKSEPDGDSHWYEVLELRYFG